MPFATHDTDATNVMRPGAENPAKSGHTYGPILCAKSLLPAQSLLFLIYAQSGQTRGLIWPDWDDAPFSGSTDSAR
jgi:hypothetical protein